MIDDQTGRRMMVPTHGWLRVSNDVTEERVLDFGEVRIPMLAIVEKKLDGPEAEDGVLYIVSGLVAARARREDFVVVSRQERSYSKVVTGAKALARIRKEDEL